MSSQLAKIVYALLPKKTKENLTKAAISIIGFIILLPVILLLVLFDPGSTTNAEDTYETILNNSNCSIHADRLKEIRAIESFISTEIPDLPMDENSVEERMMNVYFSSTENACAMREDAVILETLNQEYGLPIDKNEKLLEVMNEMRSGNETMMAPLEPMSVEQNYGIEDLQGIELKSNKRNEVKSALSGTVLNIFDSSDTIQLSTICRDGSTGCTYNKRLGKTIVIVSTQSGDLQDDGNLKEITYQLSYSHLDEINVSIGDTITAGDVIGKLKDELLYLQISKNGEIMNPENYFVLYQKMSTEVKAKLGEIEMQLPLATPYVVSAGFGMYDPFDTGSHMHYGIDLAGKAEDPILSATDGTVVNVLYNSTGGNQIIIQSGDFYFLYAHMSQRAFYDVGDTVERGDVIGTMGATGKVTGVHLHFQINNLNGNALDPSEIMDF